jgi:hypothetical protein
MAAPVLLIVTTVNHSNKDLHYSLTNPGFDYAIDVQDESGTPVPETEHRRPMKEGLRSGLRIMGRNIMGTLKPHETAQEMIEVSYFYDLRRPGEYSVQVQREFPKIGKELLKSNRLEFAITP